MCHAYPLHSVHCDRRLKQAAWFCGVDQLAHGHLRAGDQVLQDAGRDPADALGLAAVVAKRELVEIGLQMLGPDGAVMRAE